MPASESVYFFDLPSTSTTTATEFFPPEFTLRLFLPHLHAEEADALCSMGSLLLKDGDCVDLPMLRCYLSPAQWPAFENAGFSVYHRTRDWQLVPHNDCLVCAVNDVRIDAGASCVLMSGDQIELGMLRLVVCDQQDARPDLENITTDTTDASSATDSNSRYYATALRDIDDAGSPFQDMPRFSRDLPVTKNSHQKTDLSHAGQDVIAQLAEQYVRAISNPASIHTHQAAADTGQRRGDSGATLDILARSHPTHYSLEDALSGPLTIDLILAGLGPLDNNWDRRAPAEDVLMLFADDIQTRTKTPLPDLTRREHHNLSPDSHVTMASSATR